MSTAKTLATSGLRHFNKACLFGRAVLYSDRMVFVGVTVLGPFRRTIRLSDVANVAADPGSESQTVFVRLTNGESIEMRLTKGAFLWELYIADHAGLQRSGVILPDKVAA